MMRSTRYILAAALALVLVTNAIVLLGVWFNRSGEPDATVTLTERELSLPLQYRMTKENSGLSLQLVWRVLREHETFDRFNYYYNINPEWLDHGKLAELGFDVTADPDSPEGRRRYNKMLPKEALLVMEFDGDAYRRIIDLTEQHLRDEEALAAANPGKEEFVKRVAAAREVLEAEKRIRSRLFVVDGGTDAGELRVKYPDRTRYIIAQGVVRVVINRYVGLKNHSGEEKTRLEGVITEVHMAGINVPLALRGPLDPLIRVGMADRMYNSPPRYTVTLNVGRRLEPWITDISALVKE